MQRQAIVDTVSGCRFRGKQRRQLERNGGDLKLAGYPRPFALRIVRPIRLS